MNESPQETSRRVWIIVVVVIAICAVPVLLPVAIFLVKVGWPRIKERYHRELPDLEKGAPGSP